jgi:hypothetical protein
MIKTSTIQWGKNVKLLKDSNLWVSSILIVTTIILSIAAYLRWIQLNFFVGPLRFTHWLVWIGTLFVAVYSPAYYILKRRYPTRIQALLKTHVFGNLFSFMLVSIHFAQQIGRPPQFYPDLGTGVALYIVMLVLVASGFLHRFQILRTFNPHLNRFLHISVTMSFYIIILIHILQGIGLL